MPKKMRIAYFLGDFPSTSETFVLNQIAGVMEAGHKVDIHAWKDLKQVKHGLLAKYKILQYVFYRPAVPDGKVLRILKFLLLLCAMLLSDGRRTWTLFAMRKHMPLREWIELFFIAFPLRGKQVYDVIHAHFGPNGLMAVRLRQAGFLQGKIVTSFHGFDANVVPNILGKDYYRTLFEQGEAFIVSSLFIRERLLQLGCDTMKIQRIPVGVEVQKWGFKTCEGNTAENPTIISVGRLVEVKGFTYAIAALPYVKEIFPQVKYQVVGDGPLRAQLQQQVMGLGLQDCVHFCGAKSQDELIKMYHDADLFVMPSVRSVDGAEEGQGMVLLEAQAAGLPVLATYSGGIPESVPDTNVLVKEKDVEALAQAMIVCLKSYQLDGYDGYAAYEFIQKNFDIDILNQKLLKLYEALA
ncbi:MAG: glycosyltransferase [Mariprofundaceae bacterium]|nr:glycosyltransferase [Mariprofundaceae bacterium]